MTTPLVPFPDAWASTSHALHGFSRVVGAVPRAHAAPQPNWWHIGLTIDQESLVTAPVPLPDGATLRLGLTPTRRSAWMETTGGSRIEFPLTDGLSPNDLAEAVFENTGSLGLADEYDRSRFESDEHHPYDVAAAEAYWANLTAFAAAMERRREAMDGPGEIHVWPHHFDMSFEWYGSRRVDAGGGETARAQINLGFNVLDEQYAYSSPWPFDEALTSHQLPGGARWHTEGWKGSMLPFEAIVDAPDWDDQVLDYARAVFEIALPTLTA